MWYMDRWILNFCESCFCINAAHPPVPKRRQVWVADSFQGLPRSGDSALWSTLGYLEVPLVEIGGYIIILMIGLFHVKEL